MLKRYFIPLILVLLSVAIAIYFLTRSTSSEHDVRDAVPVEKFTLSNGLEVVVMPNARIPVITHMLIVKAGAADDPYGKSGLAHYLEHLMFAGTKNFPEGVYDRAIGRVGGTQNAYTMHDYTLYYATVPKEHVPMVMTMEADRFANLAIDGAIAARELNVITEERTLRVDNNPVSQWMEQIDAITFLNHPYHQPVIGWGEDMATFTPEDAQRFFAAHYRPSNMILLVAGDITAREVRRYAQRYYGGWNTGAVTARNWPKEPPVRMARRGDMQDVRVKEPRVLQQYVAPSARDGNTAQAMALAVFAQYLGGGDSSVLYEALVRQQKLATAVEVYYEPLRLGPSTLRIVATPATGVSPTQLNEALSRELALVLNAPLDEAAVNRAKTLLKADIIYAQDGLQGLANTMASLYAIGLDENYFYQWAPTVGAVTGESARAAAKAVIVPSKSVTGFLLPQSVMPPVTPSAATEVPHE